MVVAATRKVHWLPHLLAQMVVVDLVDIHKLPAVPYQFAKSHQLDRYTTRSTINYFIFVNIWLILVCCWLSSMLYVYVCRFLPFLFQFRSIYIWLRKEKSFTLLTNYTRKYCTDCTVFCSKSQLSINTQHNNRADLYNHQPCFGRLVRLMLKGWSGWKGKLFSHKLPF